MRDYPIDQSESTIGILIDARMKALSLTRGQLAQRWGYRNVAKGVRRLHEIRFGCFRPDQHQIAALASALEVSTEDVSNALTSTHEAILEAKALERKREWDEWCKCFVPHAILTTERKVPEQLFILSMLGGAERVLRIDFDYSRPSSQWITEVQRKLPKLVPCFARVTGFVINYAPYLAKQYDLEGSEICILDTALRPGRVSFFIGGKDVTKLWASVVGNAENESKTAATQQSPEVR